MKTTYYSGAVNGSLIAIVGLSVLLMAVGGLAIWSYSNYVEAQTDLDGKIANAASEAKREQAEADEIKYLEEAKNPNLQFVGPSDYGRVTFNYPKTWSTYIANDASGGGIFEAFLHPVAVPQIKQNERYALRVIIEDRPYEDVLNSFQGQIEGGQLKTSSVTVNEATGQRLDGSFSEDFRGSAVVFKIRDKTLTLRTDAQVFTDDFNKIVQTIEFND